MKNISFGRPAKKMSKKLLFLGIVMLVAIVFIILSLWPNVSQSREVQAQGYIGLSESEAQQKAQKEQVVYRVVKRDGKGLTILDDFRENRINVTIEHGRITNAAFDGADRK